MTHHPTMPLISALKFNLPSLTADELAAAISLPLIRTSFDFAAGPIERVEVTLDTSLKPRSVAEEIDITVDAATFTIRLEQPILGPLLDRSGYPGALAAMAGDPMLAGIVLEHLLTPALGKLEADRGLSVRINRVATASLEQAPAELRVSFELGSELWGSGCVGEMIARSPAAAEALRTMFAQLAPPPGAAPLDLPMSAALLGPAFRSSRKELAALVPGDGLLLDPDFTLQGPLYLRFGARKMARVDWRDKRLVVTGLANTATPLEEIHAMDGFDNETITIDDVPVTLSLELDRVEVTFASLSDLRTGSVIPFKTGKPESVRVLANGKPFATADLLQIDGRLGVRITALASRTE